DLEGLGGQTEQNPAPRAGGRQGQQPQQQSEDLSQPRTSQQTQGQQQQQQEDMPDLNAEGEPMLNPASQRGSRRAASNSDEGIYSPPRGTPPSAPPSNRGASFSDDEDFLRSQDTIADSNEEDSPHKFHAALVTTGALISTTDATTGTQPGLGIGIDFE